MSTEATSKYDAKRGYPDVHTEGSIGPKAASGFLANTEGNPITYASPSTKLGVVRHSIVIVG